MTYNQPLLKTKIGRRPYLPNSGYIAALAEDRSQRCLGGEGAAEAVDAGAGWCGGGADKDGRVGSGVEADRRAEEGLQEGHGSAGDVAADVVGVAMLNVGCVELAASEDAVTEAGGETLDLPLDRVGHIDGRASGDVAISPAGVEAGGRIVARR
jgi:hypothetical protein